ncbi:glycoside hydrolase family 3 N-terminal domain-containing protein [Altericista sp. CCNU0014]|uniref:glycoside hydrolase family 3 N-terminal domain-containing protein n=1 Tax=Altericista sp. CCNU0014 TaxID=3082949 RepID=UPI00384F64CB
MTHLLPDFQDLTLAERVAQMLVVRASGYLFDHQILYPTWEPKADTLRHYLQDLAVGGVIVLGGSAAEIALRSQQLQDWAKVPLFLAADIEEGVGQRFSGATWFPPPMALAAIAKTHPETALHLAVEMGAATAQEALAIGLNWVLAPITDVNNNPQNPVINVRAFGETLAVVSQLATAFIQGARQHPVLTTAKHFPGHGDTTTDSHLDLPVIPHALERLQRLEYLPFRAAIAAGVDSVMSAHLSIPALDETYPATLSPRILTGELREALGFDGIIVTDALVMGAIADRYGADEAAVLAVEAGADVLMMPLDPPGAIQAICAAVESGRITADRIQASLERVWRAKQKIFTLKVDEGSHRHAWEQRPPAPIQLDALAQFQFQQAAVQILEKSSQFRGTLSQGEGFARNAIVVDDLIGCDFLNRKAPAIALPQMHGYPTLYLVDRHSPSQPCDLVETHPEPTLLQLFIRGNPFRGSAGLSQLAKDWFDALLQKGLLRGLVIYGSPYTLDAFLPLLPPEIPYGFSYGQMPMAQAIVLNSLIKPA